MATDPPTNTRPRVAIVTSCLRLGGSTTFVLNLGAELRRRGWELRIWCFDPGLPLADDFALANLDVRLINQDRVIFEDHVEQVLRELREWEPAVVIANLGPDAFDVLRYLPKGVLRVGIAHSDDPIVYELHDRYAGSLDVSVGVSRLIAKQLAALDGIAPDHVRLLEYGVHFPAQSPEVESPNDAPLRIIYLGRLDQEQKRVRLFPQILRELIEAGIAFEWTLAGEGPERDFLEKEMTVSSAGATVRFAGQVNPRDVPELLSRQDVFLLASDYEGLPLSLLESMGAGLVPVVSDLPSGIRDLVDDSCGFRIDPADTPGYAKALVKLAKDPAIRKRMAAKASARALREYTVAAMTDRWEALLHEACLEPVHWPTQFQIEAPLGAKHPGYYRGLARVARRLAKKLKG